jgi:hypothetical protein
VEHHPGRGDCGYYLFGVLGDRMSD